MTLQNNKKINDHLYLKKKILDFLVSILLEDDSRYEKNRTQSMHDARFGKQKEQAPDSHGHTYCG